MWLTGLDVPCLSTLYLDKPLKAHTLMQAIARANRVHEGKNNGLIVDFVGVFQNLEKALAAPNTLSLKKKSPIYTDKHRKEGGPCSIFDHKNNPFQVGSGEGY